MADLVSIVTPTIPERRADLLECIENIRRQTYPSIEHIIVHDGSVPLGLPEIYVARDGAPPIRQRNVALGRHWTGFLSDSYAAAPVIVGQLLARGEYTCLWADDERGTPDHLAKMVELIEATGVDFVYPTVEFWWHNRPEEATLIGSDPPHLGSITHWLYRPEMIERARGPYRTHVGRANDWEFIERAMAGGASWAWLQEVTFSHRADD